MADTVWSVRLPRAVSSSPSASSAARISTNAFCTIGECAISSSAKSNARRIAPLAELLRAGFFSPSDDADSDSYETQRDRFDEEALHMATRLLLSDEEACRTSIAEAVRRELLWLCPRGRTVEIRVSRPDVRVTLAETAGETAS